MPLAFFCTLFFRHRKKSVSAPWDGKSHFAPESARQAPPRGISSAEVSLCGASRGLSARPLHPFGEPAYPQGKGMRQRARWGLSSGQTIGAARTAVRPACCLPELRGANRLRRLYPLDDGELFKFNLKSSVCQRQTGLPKGNPPCVFPPFPPVPFGSPSETIARPISLQALLPRRSRCDLPPHKNTGRFSPPVSKPFSFFLFPFPTPSA